MSIALERSNAEQAHEKKVKLLEKKMNRAREELNKDLAKFENMKDYECVICEEEFPLQSGILCRNIKCNVSQGEANDGDGENFLPAFICDECFTGHVKSQASEPIEKLKKRNANVTCVCCETILKYELQEIALHLRSDDTAFAKLIQSQQMLFQHKLEVESVDRIKTGIKKELSRLAKMTEQERKLDEACKHIRENILTLKCPRCGQAFVDFEACFALRCKCGAAFCGWCLKDCGNDAHAHVATCTSKLDNDKYFSSPEKFKEAQNKRRRALILKYMTKKKFNDSERCNIALKLLTDLTDLGLVDIVKGCLEKVIQ